VFSAKNGAVTTSEEQQYIEDFSMESYDTNECARYCLKMNTCHGINTYVQRVPLWNPGPDCSNPNSTAVFKCVLWTLRPTEQQVGNTGQMQYEFSHVIAGSNAYGRQPLMDASNSTYPNGTAEAQRHDGPTPTGELPLGLDDCQTYAGVDMTEGIVADPYGKSNVARNRMVGSMVGGTGALVVAGAILAVM
jgi:hypothetical protein